MMNDRDWFMRASSRPSAVTFGIGPRSKMKIRMRPVTIRRTSITM